MKRGHAAKIGEQAAQINPRLPVKPVAPAIAAPEPDPFHMLLTAPDYSLSATTISDRR
jgi:hypothetical protein